MARVFTGMGGGGGPDIDSRIATSSDGCVVGDLVYFDAFGGVSRTRSSLLLSPRRYLARAVVTVAAPMGGVARIATGGDVAVRFLDAPLASDNGARVYVSDATGAATLAVATPGFAVSCVGVLTGGDGSTLTPTVQLSFEAPIEVP